ncbi:MAG: o-succinylbenzoate synthase [Chloroflexi bacterium]|nr:MAG: o-succinylbenzoate synthase [Chloroflexota bacterium]MBL1193489.1 o-succinylbenzoate synthase [Chloroflexota bacterium]NOH10780.1 o-succinylbenzoate synthase [Chloroflexota bacterium]
MRIERLDLHHLRMPLKSAFETSFGRIETRDCILVAAYADGLVGYGESAADRDPGYSYETSGTAWHILQDYLAPAVLGEKIPNAEDYQARVSGVRGHLMAKAGLEMALWDLWGKQANKSLCELFGGESQRVDVGVSIGLQASPEALVETASDYLKKGYRRIKIKIKPGRDVGDVEAMRRTFPDLKMQVDANSAYTLDTADVLLPLDEFELLLIEQPLAEDDLWDHSQLAPRFKTPLCLDESITSLKHARQALEMKACGIVNIKAGRVGGLSQGVAIHNLCLDQDVPVWCGGLLETGVGRSSNLALASLPGFTLPGDISATERYYDEDIIEEEFVLNEDSTIDVPGKPGLGITIDQKAVKKYSLQNMTLSA